MQRMAYGLLCRPSNGAHLLGRVVPPGLFFMPRTWRPRHSAGRSLNGVLASTLGSVPLPLGAAAVLLAGGVVCGVAALGVLAGVALAGEPAAAEFAADGPDDAAAEGAVVCGVAVLVVAGLLVCV